MGLSLCFLFFFHWFLNAGEGVKKMEPSNTVDRKVNLCSSFREQYGVQFSSVTQSCPTLLIPWTAARQDSLSITNSQSPLKPIAIELVMPSNHLILCRPLLLLPLVFPSISVFANESALCIRWPKYWSFSFNISPSNDHPGLISFRMDLLDLLAV